MFPSGTFAVNLDPRGSGFVQYPNGNIYALINAEERTATVFDQGGVVLCQVGGSGDSGDRSPVDLQLSPNLGFRLDPSDFTSTVYFSYDNVRHRLTRGQNDPQGTSLSSLPEGARPAFLSKLGNAKANTAAAAAKVSTGAATKKGPPPAASTGLKGLNDPVGNITATGDSIANALDGLHADLMRKIQGLKQLDAAAGLFQSPVKEGKENAAEAAAAAAAAVGGGDDGPLNDIAEGAED
jgi:hypothetical protein